MTCTDFLAKLTDYFDGRVEPALLVEVEHHIAECKHCEVVLDSTTKTINIYRDHEIYDFPPELEQRLTSAIMNRCIPGHHAAAPAKQLAKH
jgi:anti-sigma factor RsiW